MVTVCARMGVANMVAAKNTVSRDLAMDFIRTSKSPWELCSARSRCGLLQLSFLSNQGNVCEGYKDANLRSIRCKRIAAFQNETPISALGCKHRVNWYLGNLMRTKF